MTTITMKLQRDHRTIQPTWVEKWHSIRDKVDYLQPWCCVSKNGNPWGKRGPHGTWLSMCLDSWHSIPNNMESSSCYHLQYDKVSNPLSISSMHKIGAKWVRLLVPSGMRDDAKLALL
jgi:hypothetical protein